MRFRIKLIEFGERVFLFYFAPRRMALVNILLCLFFRQEACLEIWFIVIDAMNFYQRYTYSEPVC